MLMEIPQQMKPVTWRSRNISWRTASMVSGTKTDFGRHSRNSSVNEPQPRLNFPYHRLEVCTPYILVQLLNQCLFISFLLLCHAFIGPFEPNNCWKVLIRCFLFLPRRQRLRQSPTTTNDRRSPSSTRHFQFITQIFLLSTTKIENIAKMAATLPESEDDVPMLDEEREINSSIAPLADEHTISTTTDSAILADNVATATNKKTVDDGFWGSSRRIPLNQ
ncbi:uncharacterized protein LOC142227622 [Haematobia irritans]|uniref:uncharacterized protein LOC142227622 n=1 Tax=Haematobia irritans TaxID=7368 RepID=UPI003F501CC8